MPQTTPTGEPLSSELPAPLRRSPAKAQRTFAQAHGNALREDRSDGRTRAELYERARLACPCARG